MFCGSNKESLSWKWSIGKEAPHLSHTEGIPATADLGAKVGVGAGQEQPLPQGCLPVSTIPG